MTDFTYTKWRAFTLCVWTMAAYVYIADIGPVYTKIAIYFWAGGATFYLIEVFESTVRFYAQRTIDTIQHHVEIGKIQAKFDRERIERRIESLQEKYN